MNKVFLMGNLGQKPELRHSKTSGAAVLNLRMATNRRVKDGDGEWHDEADWHSVVVFGRRAEGLAKVLDKGSKILVEGRLQTRQWEDKQGNNRYTTEVIAWEVEFAGGRGRQEPTSGNFSAPPAPEPPPPGRSTYAAGAKAVADAAAGSTTDYSDDIPF